MYTYLTMSSPEQPALPYYENTDINDVRFPWATFEEVADRAYLPSDTSLAEMRQQSAEPIQPYELQMTDGTTEQAFMQRVLAYQRRCEDISMGFINDDSEKYYTVRHSMALRVVGLYFTTQHFIDASSELRFLERELKITPENPLIGFTHSAIVALQSIPRDRSEPAKEISYIQPHIPYE